MIEVIGKRRISCWRGWLAGTLALLSSAAVAVTVEFNNTGGTTATNGLHFYIEDTTKLQVRRLNNTGQVYQPTSTPASTSLDNGIFLRANGKVYGPSHNVSSFTPTGGMYNTYSIGTVSPANPATPGMQQSVTGNFRITSGPQVSVVWKYTTPLDFLTAEVTLTIPIGYAVSAANPVRYYHAVDTYLGGSDNGCGVTFVDGTTGKRMVGTYPSTSGTCSSSTSIPSGVSVVESFRERSGLSFSNYCAAGWSTFYANGTPNCSVLQTAVLSNTITTTWQDTGVGVEFDFTAPGTYTFSYDFVIGSPLVPPYDHLEIQHDGSATLCPESVTVLACTSAVVPCPAASLVNTGTLTGSLTVSPTTPAVTISPATFTLGATATTATVTLQGSGAGTYALGTSNPSSIPLNGTKCYNTATGSQSCTLTIAATPCVGNFECIATSQTYNNLVATPTARNPLYTQLAGTTAFSFDVVALTTPGARVTTYAADADKTVTVELVDGSGSAACASRASRATKSLVFTKAAQPTEQGRKTVSFTVTNAYPNLRCRVTDANYTPSVVGCSSDVFALRPQSFSVSSSMNADASGANAAAIPRLKTGAGFTLTANAGAVGYNGTPAINTAKAEAHSGSVATGAVVGGFVQANTTTGIAEGSAFTYDEVGYFRFKPEGVYDDNFTAIDQNGDCTSDFSNVAVSGKVGCKFGNTANTNFFGRFIPDHFNTTVIQGCDPGAFTYSAQPFDLTVTALNGAGGTGATTYNYSGTFAKTVALSDANSVTGGILAPTSIAGTSFDKGVATLTRGDTTPPIFTFTRGTPDHAPDTIKLRAIDSDGVSSATGTEGTTLIRIGRLRLSNVYGYTSPLRMPVEAQFWSGKSWLTNTDDICTPLGPGNVTSGAWPREIRRATDPYLPTTKLVDGKAVISLAPTGPGFVSVCADLGNDNGVACAGTGPAALPWLQSKWPPGTSYDTDPSATATFGVFSPEGKRGVYNREMY